MARVKKTKSKFRFTPQFGILMIFLLGLIVSSVWILIPSRSQRLNDAFGNILPDDHRVVELRNVDALEARIDSGQLTFLFFGVASESTSRDALSSIYGFLSSELFRQLPLEVDAIHFLDAGFITELDEEDEDYDQTIENYTDRLGFDVSNTPDFVVFYEGEVIFDTEPFRDEDGNFAVVNWTGVAYRIIFNVSNLFHPLPAAE